MTIGCTRCGVQQEGEILNVVIAFKFPHKKGCGQGIGPLCIVPASKKNMAERHAEIQADAILKDIGEITEIRADIKVSPKGKPIDEPAKKSKSKIEKIKVFGKKD